MSISRTCHRLDLDDFKGDVRFDEAGTLNVRLISDLWVTRHGRMLVQATTGEQDGRRWSLVHAAPQILREEALMACSMLAGKLIVAKACAVSRGMGFRDSDNLEAILGYGGHA